LASLVPYIQASLYSEASQAVFHFFLTTRPTEGALL
jgi:hypothetical protein